MDLFYFPAIVLISFFYILKKHYSKISNHIITKSLLAIFLVFNLYGTSQNIKDRYDPNFKFNKNYNYSFYKLNELRQFLSELGIQYPNTVLSMEDVSPNCNLYYYNLKGWSGFALSGKPFSPKLTDHFIHELRVEYLILSDSTYLKHENIQPYIDHHLGTFDNSIFVYDLRPYRK